jgi:hypothetical protein
MIFIANLFISLVIVYLLLVNKIKNIRMLIGLIFLIVFYATLIHDFKNDFDATYLYADAQCKVVNQDIQTKLFFHIPIYYPSFWVQFSAEEQFYNTKAKLNIADPGYFSYARANTSLNPYYIGETYPCWYNPSDPNIVVFQQGWFTWTDYWQVTLLGLFIFILMAL